MTVTLPRPGINAWAVLLWHHVEQEARAMVRFLEYAVLRSLYPLLALGAIWGSLLWGPWLSLPLAILMLHLVTYVERWTGPSPPGLVTAPSWFGRWLSHPEVSGFVTPGQKLGFALGAGMWLGWCGGINMGVNFHSHAGPDGRIYTQNAGHLFVIGE